jgi:hypothetical protein
VKLGCGALAILIGVSTTLARAEGTARFSRVALLLPACELPGLGPSELRSALALDLRDEHLTLAPPGELSPSSDVLVSFETRCDGPSTLALRAEHQGERHARTIDLGELPAPQRARALSLALAELLSLFEHPATPPADIEAPAAAEPAPAVTPAPAPAKPAAPAVKAPPKVAPAAPPLAPPPAADRAPARRQSSRQWQVALAPELRFFQTSLLWGARAVLRYRGFSAGAVILTTRTAVPAGSVVILTPHAVLGYSLQLWNSEAAELDVGPRLGAGRTFMNATASSSGRAISAQDVYVDAAAGLRYSFRIAPRWSCGFSAELGYASGPIGYADDQEIARTSGLFAGAVFEVGLWL